MMDIVERLREASRKDDLLDSADMADAADEITRLRAQVEILSEQLTMESIDTTCRCAAKSAADCGCPGAVWPEDALRARVTDLESDLADKATLIEVLLSEIACHMADKRELDASQTERRVRR